MWICFVLWERNKTCVSAFGARTQYLFFSPDDSFLFCPSNVFFLGCVVIQVDRADGKCLMQLLRELRCASGFRNLLANLLMQYLWMTIAGFGCAGTKIFYYWLAGT